MEEKKDGLIANLFSKKNDLIKLIFSAAILSLGINLSAYYICKKLESSPNIILLISILTILSIVIYVVFLFFKNSEKEINISSAIAIDKDSKKIISIPRYEFSEDLSRNISSVFIENEAFKKIWFDEIFPKKTKTPLSTAPKTEEGTSTNEKKDSTDVEYISIVKQSISDEDIQRKTNNAEKLLNEAIEYTILEKLSLTLSTYFNNFSEEDKYIKTYTREDIPQYLLKNRILNLLSTPISDRSTFIKSGINQNPPKGEIVAIMGSDGTQYNKFDLILPKNSVIKRHENGILQISNNSIDLQIQINNNGFTANTAPLFEKYYLGFHNPRKLIARKIDIKIFYKVKLLTIFSSKRKKYHSWVDYFSNELMDYCSFKLFLKKIHWEECLTNIIVAKQKERLQASANKP